MPKFSVASTLIQCQRTIDIKEIPHDMKVDDIYISAADGEEYRPPPRDAWGRERRTNLAALLAKRAQKHIEDMIKYEMSGRYSSLGATASEKGKKKGGPGSTLSRKSSLAGRSSLSISADKRAEKEENSNNRQAASP